MGILDDLIKSIQLPQNISNQLGFATQLSEIAKANELWKENLSGFKMLNEIVKSFNQQTVFYSSHFKGIDAFVKSIASIKKFEIPSSTFDAIKSINLQHQQFFGNIKNFTNDFQHHSAFTQLNSLQIALSGMSGQLASIAAASKQWNLIEDFEEISKQATAIGNSITNNNVFTKQDAQKINDLIEQIDFKFDTKDHTFKSKLFLWLNVFVIFMTIHMYIDFLNSKSNIVIKDDIIFLKKEIIQTIENKLKKENEYRTTNRICKVLSKPKGKMILAILPKEFDVIVMQVNHKWIYVSYISPKDNLPQTGWILKKYLSQP